MDFFFLQFDLLFFLIDVFFCQASYLKVFYVGPNVGAAMIIKVVSNMLCCVNVIAMGEALMLGG